MLTPKYCSSGGLETLFGNSKEHSLQVESENGEVGLEPCPDNLHWITIPDNTCICNVWPLNLNLHAWLS